MRFTNNLILTLLALLAGALLPFAFAPFNAYPIAFVAPALLLFVWLRSTPWQALYRGFFFGIGFFAVGASWIYISIHTYGNAGAVLAGLITFLFVLILALSPAIQGFLFALLFRNSRFTLRCLLAFPALWVLSEWLRSWMFSGFPWLFIGYSQIHSILRGYAPFLDVYGVSLIVAFIAGCLVVLLTPPPTQKKGTLHSKITSLVLIILLFGIGFGITGIKWTQPSGKAFTTSLVQGNIAQTLKWNDAYLLNILKIYQSETEQHWNSKIIVWPEAAVPAFREQVQFFFNFMEKQASQHHSALVLGVPTMNPKTRQYYNSMVVLGNGKGVYSKRKLVPFGEYIPLKTLFSGVMKYFNIPMSGFTPGPQKQPPMIAAGIPFAPFICYEIAYPIEVINSMHNAQLMIVISDDSWFGNSIASPQQVQIAQMRALETGRYVLYSTNTGITAIINPQGKIEHIAPVNQQTVLTARVTPMNGKTPLMRWNYYPDLGILLVFLLLAFFL